MCVATAHGEIEAQHIRAPESKDEEARELMARVEAGDLKLPE